MQSHEVLYFSGLKGDDITITVTKKTTNTFVEVSIQFL